MNEKDIIKKHFVNPNNYIARFDSCDIVSHNRTHDGVEFKLFEFYVTILSAGKFQNMELRGTMSVKRAQQYFEYCHVSTSQAKGKLVQVTVETRTFNSNGQEYQVDEIKYLNLLRDNGTPIIMI